MHKLDQRLDAAANPLHQIEPVKREAVPGWIASKAQCTAVAPGLVKGAFIAGAEHGQRSRPRSPSWRTRNAKDEAGV